MIRCLFKVNLNKKKIKKDTHAHTRNEFAIIHIQIIYTILNYVNFCVHFLFIGTYVYVIFRAVFF